MLYNKIIKFSYHFFVCLFLYNLTITLKLSTLNKIILYLIILFHAYDVYWFYNYDSNAPI